MTGRNSQVARFYQTLQLLCNNTAGLTVSDIQSKLEARGHLAAKRTIYRDLAAIEAAGFPLCVSEDIGEHQAQRFTLLEAPNLTKLKTINREPNHSIEHFVDEIAHKLEPNEVQTLKRLLAQASHLPELACEAAKIAA